MPLHIPTSLVVMNLVGVQNGKVDTFFGALSNIKKRKDRSLKGDKKKLFFLLKSLRMKKGTCCFSRNIMWS